MTILAEHALILLSSFTHRIPHVDLDEDLFAQNLGPLNRRNRTKTKVRPTPDPLPNRTREYLHRFFKPYNDELADLLGEEWRGVWDFDGDGEAVNGDDDLQ